MTSRSIRNRSRSPTTPGVEYVPILEPTVVIVEERLPPGAAAAVLNRAHQHTDIVLFVDQNEREALAAIDGVAQQGSCVPIAPDLLERLWRHDLIVFDASASPTGCGMTNEASAIAEPDAPALVVGSSRFPAASS